jgi:tRNA 5-methylaminomethyl-2-thiouridine biosynthesis bifunctional protein
MTDAPSASTQSPLDWGDDGQPRSRLYGDVYFSREDGLAESRAVFLQGCGLPEAWSGRSRFVVGELGFGTGLNILALLDLWRRTRPPGARLHVFSIEAHPITANEARRALAHWPELEGPAALLLSRWPGRARGLHRIELPELDAVLDVCLMEARDALAGWSGRADAWFLDGFSPALNPEMWSDEVLRLVGERSAPGARAATFTVAGQVRRGLAAAGFQVDKRPGFGRKRERLEARLSGQAVDIPSPKVAVIGAGIAGASAARALRALGAEVEVFEAEQPGAGASGNPAGLVTPRLDAGFGPPAQLFAQAFRRAVQLYEATPEAVIARTVLQLAAGPRDEDRFARIAAANLFEPGALEMLSPSDAERRLGAPAPAALAQETALVVRPAAILEAWLGPISPRAVAALKPDGSAWLLLAEDGEVLSQVAAVVLAAGAGSTRLLDVPLQPIRGQASWTRDADVPQAAAWGGYVLPTGGGLLFGATHDRDQSSCEVREEDHRRNLEGLAKALPELATRLSDAPLEGRASVRAATPDRLPLAGEASGAPGLHLLTGFGSRGLAMAPLLAEHVAAAICTAPSPLARELAELVSPDRFAKRLARRS